MAALPQHDPQPSQDTQPIRPAGEDPVREARGIATGVTVGAVMWGLVILAFLILRRVMT